VKAVQAAGGTITVLGYKRVSAETAEVA
jgi:hypothetical protein